MLGKTFYYFLVTLNNFVFGLRMHHRIRVCTGGRTDRQTECISTFQLCWKVLKSYLEMKQKKIYIKPRFLNIKCVENLKGIFFFLRDIEIFARSRFD